METLKGWVLSYCLYVQNLKVPERQRSINKVKLIGMKNIVIMSVNPSAGILISNPIAYTQHVHDAHVACNVYLDPKDCRINIPG